MGMRMIYNHSEQPIQAMYNGEIFEIPARSQVALPSELALFFVDYYGPRGLSFEPIGSRPYESVRCPYCGKEFGDRDRPQQALRQHIRIAHRAEEPAADQELGEATDAGEQATND